ncbi:MAG: protein-L-isoaspartate O-methyltransferase family protein [Acetobacteraceae bacterium]
MDTCTARVAFAEELRVTAKLRSPAVIRAFATVPRERFVGPGPWRVRNPTDAAEYWTTDNADPRHVYHDVLIAVDETRGLNNGQPSLWASLLDDINLSPGEHVLHLGCGTGYYSAILAELVRSRGSVSALEIDERLAGRAQHNLATWPQATAINADASLYVPSKVDAAVASAGATHPLPIWLDALNPGGRLLLPLTAEHRAGVVLLATRQTGHAFVARLIRPAGFIEFIGARGAAAERLLKRALDRGNTGAVTSLRRDQHTEDASCWLHGDGYCLSTRPV